MVTDQKYMKASLDLWRMLRDLHIIGNEFSNLEYWLKFRNFGRDYRPTGSKHTV